MARFMFLRGPNSRDAVRRRAAELLVAAALGSAWSVVSSTAAHPAASAPAAHPAASAAAAPPLLSVNKAGLWELGPDYKPVRRLSEANDYVYRSLIILDAQTGELLCLDERRITRRPARRVADCSGISVVGESEVHWLAEPDRLLVEGTLFDLEKLRAVTVGSLVR